ncbi:MAG: acetyl-CoA carboxylase carboxyltransferase subunit beta [Chloroflexi bacterium]|nr:acetyl-CoA carboxylase carboxyltransferase subunit beta [Chloroflexota bacterium]
MDIFRRPKTIIGAAVRERSAPANLWVKCGRCKELSYVREFEQNAKVCGKCGHHARLSAAERLQLLLDPDSFREIDRNLLPADPLEFVGGGKRYPEKISEVQQETGLTEAAVCGTGTIEGRHLVVAVLDFSFLGASMGSVVGEKVSRSVELALFHRIPLLTISASGGARMHEGILSLMQMAKTVSALARLADAQVPHFSLLTDPTTGGVTASFASLGDVILAEPGALIGFAGPRVIEQITRQKLPPGFQTAEFVLEHGMIDMVVHRRELRTTLAGLLSLYQGVRQRRRVLDHAVV